MKAPILHTEDASIAKVGSAPGAEVLLDVVVRYHEKGYVARIPVLVPKRELDPEVMRPGQRLRVEIWPIDDDPEI